MWGKLALAGATLALGACSTTPAGSDATPEPPPVNGQFDYQIGGPYSPSSSADIVVRDRGEDPAPNAYNVCYVNAFQAQPDADAWWKSNHDDLLLNDSGGVYVADTEWNELLLDTSTESKRSALGEIVGEWIDECAASGYDAVEPDNLDSYTRSSGLLTQQNATDFATELTERAHEAGVAIAQKNDSSIAPLADRIGFDFAIVEECQEYDECEDFTTAYDAHVYEIEYTDGGGMQNFTDACEARGATTSVTLRDRNVVPEGWDGYVYETC